MRRLILSVVLALAAPLAFAGTPPTNAQVDALLEVTNAKHLVDTMFAQIEATQKTMIDKALEGKQVTPEQRQKIDRLMARMAQRTRDTLSWDKLRPMYYRIYASTFDAQDIDAMIAFYKTPAGQHVIERMPTLMQNTMGEIGQLIGPLLQEFDKDVEKEFSTPAADPAPTAAHQ